MKIIYISLFNLCFPFVFLNISLNEGKVSTLSNDRARQTAIQDFSKTKLFKIDSVFSVTLYDTLHRINIQRVGQRNYKSVIGKSYPEIIAVDIIASSFKYLLDTTARMDMQNRRIPTRVFENGGKLFVWRDSHYPLTDTTVKILTKFHLIKRGRKSDLNEFLYFGTDDSKQGADYYFCRNNLPVYKKIITNKAIGEYDPPNISCNE